MGERERLDESMSIASPGSARILIQRASAIFLILALRNLGIIGVVNGMRRIWLLSL
jgi:hypothetical protein